MLFLGEDGWLWISYVGPWTGVIKGPCTGYGYRVHASVNELFMADARDVQGLAKMLDNEGKTLFDVSSQRD